MVLTCMVSVYVTHTTRNPTCVLLCLYVGLSSRYKHGLIYCTPCTAGLVQALLDVPEGVLRMLELDTEYSIAGCTVTAMDANHSPGSCMFVIKTPPTGEVGAWSALDCLSCLGVHCQAGAFT